MKKQREIEFKLMVKKANIFEAFNFLTLYILVQKTKSLMINYEFKGIVI